MRDLLLRQEHKQKDDLIGFLMRMIVFDILLLDVLQRQQNLLIFPIVIQIFLL